MPMPPTSPAPTVPSPKPVPVMEVPQQGDAFEQQQGEGRRYQSEVVKRRAGRPRQRRFGRTTPDTSAIELTSG
jgi:hypothetical protein